MSLDTLTKDGQRLGRCHIVWQVIPGPWTNNGESPVGDGCQLDRRKLELAELSGT